jgi:hypothetical protein
MSQNYRATNIEVIEIILLIANICYAIIELIILHDSYDAIHECGPNILYCIITCCVFHYLVLIVYLYCSPPSCYNNIFVSHKYKIMILMLLPGFIWSCVCLYGTEANCKNFFKDNYLHLWNMVNTEVYTGFILIALFSIVKISKYYVDRSNVELMTPFASQSQVNYVGV